MAEENRMPPEDQWRERTAGRVSGWAWLLMLITLAGGYALGRWNPLGGTTPASQPAPRETSVKESSPDPPSARPAAEQVREPVASAHDTRSAAAQSEIPPATTAAPSEAERADRAPASEPAPFSAATEVPIMEDERVPPFGVLCGSFGEVHRAQREADRLSAAGLQARIVSLRIPGVGLRHRVVAGSMQELLEAQGKAWTAVNEGWVQTAMVVAADGVGSAISPLIRASDLGRER